MNLRTVCFAAMLVAAACSPATDTDAAAVPAMGEAASAKRLPLPDCAEVQATEAGAEGVKHPDCRLMLPDQSGLAIEARYTPAEDDSTEVKIQVVQPGDATVQEIVERIGATLNGPSVEDFDKDGKADIKLPLETYTANTTWALWRQMEGNRFVRVGEPTGVSLIKTDSGYIAVQGRGSAADYYVEFYKLEGDALVPVATVNLAVQEEGEKVTGVDCTLADDGGLAALGKTPEELRLSFCAEPEVVGLVKDFTGKP
jgi:hypothetical protein